MVFKIDITKKTENPILNTSKKKEKFKILPDHILRSIFYFCSGEEYHRLVLVNKSLHNFFNRHKVLWFKSVQIEGPCHELEFNENINYKFISHLLSVKIFHKKGKNTVLDSFERCICSYCSIIEANLVKELILLDNDKVIQIRDRIISIKKNPKKCGLLEFRHCYNDLGKKVNVDYCKKCTKFYKYSFWSGHSCLGAKRSRINYSALWDYMDRV